MTFVRWLCMRAARLPLELVSMLALFVWVGSSSLAEVPKPSGGSLAVSPLSPDRERALQPKDTFTECAKCPEMVVVPTGKFMMGSPEGQGADGEHPQHEVTISNPFAIGKFEVTFAEWDSCVAADGCPQVSDHGWGRGERPVINVSWEDAQHYAAWLSGLTGKTYRLLSEAEWEFAARAGTTTRYSFGDDKAALGDYAWYVENSGFKTHPVGEKKSNPFGLYDMHGNVWEWVQDCDHDSYEGAPTDGTAWTSGDCAIRVFRGGSLDHYPGDLRSGTRYSGTAVGRSPRVSFRVGRTLTP